MINSKVNHAPSIKKSFKTYAFIFFLFLILTSTGCNNETPQTPPVTTGSITGTAKFSSGSDNSGINVVVSKSDGLTSSEETYYTAATDSHGLFLIKDVQPGNYTVYASSTKSVEKAVSRTVSVQVGQTTTIGDLVLTPTGEIRGNIAIDSSNSGNAGLMVFLEGTSFVAVTDDKGDFCIQGVPAGTKHKMFVQKGAFMDYLSEVETGMDSSSLGFSLDSSKMSLNNSIVWKGAFESAGRIESPQTNWAYFNTSDGNSYIYDGSKWNILEIGRAHV